MALLTRTLLPRNPGYFDILHITDPHIYAAPEADLLGVNTRDSLEAVLDKVQYRGHDRPDLVLVSGDIAQDLSAEAYDYFCERMSMFEVPVFWIPGNHDDFPLMRSRDQAISSDKCLKVGDWQIILLNSQVPGKVHGQLDDDELQYLETTLKGAKESPALLVTHHQPVPVGSAWLDKIGLRNAARVQEILADHPQVKAMLCGHVHQELDQTLQGRRYLATPSTCVQFQRHSEEFAASSECPGYRTLRCHADGRIETEVHRAIAFPVRVDMTMNGY